jgi:hypothetical protein
MPALSYPARRQTSLTQARTGTERGTELNVFKICLRTSDDDRTLPDMPHNAHQTRSARGEQTRAAIVEAALRMFVEHGYEATTDAVLSVMDGARRP